MRKVIICEKLTSDIQDKAAALGIGEIAQGLPKAYGHLKDLVLPAVVVESSHGPQDVLLAAALDQVSKNQLDTLQDLPFVSTKSLEDRVTEIETTLKAQVPK